MLESIRSLALLTLALGLVWMPHDLRAQAVKPLPEVRPADRSAPSPARSAYGASCEPGRAFATLDANNVRAAIYNTGTLFRGDAGGVIYEVPKASGLHSIFSHSLWVGGYVDGDLRMAAATYAQGGEDYEFYPGPIAEGGTPPSASECREWDRIFKVTRAEVDSFLADEDAEPTEDMEDWPAEAGAPFLDAEELDGEDNDHDGTVDEADEGDGKYDPDEGDVPRVTGDQTVWWVMNDAAGPHKTTDTEPMGLEVQAEAFSFDRDDALGRTTFYRYTLEYNPATPAPLEDAYIGLWVDPDLGNYTDDFVGSDSTLGMGFVYNGDQFDEGAYGDSPPALGFDFLQGPVVNDDGMDNDHDGIVDEQDERLSMEHFIYYSGDNTGQGNPDSAEEYYNYLMGHWRDGSPITYGGDGYNTGDPTDYLFSGEPPDYWSEDDVDGTGTANTPSDRRFLMSTGPFDMEPGETQEIVYAIIWSRSGDRITSVRKLKDESVYVQGVYDFDFDLPEPPDAPELSATGFDGSIALSWSNPETSNNFLNAYDQRSAWLENPNAPDDTYTFEGYIVYQYAGPGDSDPTPIATFDRVNGVMLIEQEVYDEQTGERDIITLADGTDAGVQNYLVLEENRLTGEPLRNFTRYYYGVQAYAYNEASDPQAIFSPIMRANAVPAGTESVDGGTQTAAAPGEVLEAQKGSPSDGIVEARIVNPLDVTGDTYEVRFYMHEPDRGRPFLTYNVVDVTSGEVLVDGGKYFVRTGQKLPLDSSGGTNVFSRDGLSFSIVDVPAGWAGDGEGIIETMWAGEPVDDPNEYGGVQVWHSTNSTADYFVSANGSGGLDRISRYIRDASPRDFEMRFTQEGGYAVYAFDEDDERVAEVPFELWDTGIGTPDDPSDDVRMIPFLLGTTDSTAGDWMWGEFTEGYFGYPAPAPVYWIDPNPDAGGYAGFAASAEACGVGNIYDPDGCAGDPDYHADFFSPVYPNSGFVYPIGRFMIGDFAGDGEIPPGTTIRMITNKPFAPGDVFTIDTGDYDPIRSGEALEAAIEKIAVVPNPYRGQSTYDVSNFEDQVRITNLPPRATIRIFTISGSLIRTIEKDSGERYATWNLRNMDGLPIASGLYLIHIELPNGHEKVLKFAVVKQEPRLDIF